MEDSFVIDLNVGGVRFKLATEDDDQGVSLQRRAANVIVSFVNFTGTLHIERPPQKSDTASELVEEALDKPTDAAEGTRAEKPAHDDGASRERVKNVLSKESSSFYLDEDLLTQQAVLLKAPLDSERIQLVQALSTLDMCERLKDSLDKSNEHARLPESSVVPVPIRVSRLHVACASPCISVKKLQSILRESPYSAAEVDSEGRYPLHVLSENAPLLASFVGHDNARLFCMSLLEAYPEALTSKDLSGAIPFVNVIRNWVEDAYREPQDHVDTSSGVVRNLTTRAGQVTSVLGSSDDNTAEPSFSRNKYPSVSITPEVKVAFEILSSFFDRLNESDGQRGFDREKNLIVRAALARNVAAIPSLLKTIFLIDDNVVRRDVTRTSVVVRVLFCSESVGGWLYHMLRHGDIPSERAVDYLEEVSRLTVKDFLGPRRTARSADIAAFERARKEIFDTFEDSGQMIPSVMALDAKQKGRAATTDIVWVVLNHSLSSPLVLGVLLADLVFNVVLLFTFRYASDVNMVFFGQEVTPLTGEASTLLLFLSLSCYFLLGKLCELYALMRCSTRALRSYICSFWNMIDVAAVVLALSAVLSESLSPALLALAMAALSLKLLGYLKTVNAHLATFVLAILEIVNDIKWFLVVLCIFLFMCADVVHIITLHTGDGAYCESGEAPTQFCSRGVSQAYLKLYSVIVGDIGLDDYTYDDGIEFLFVFFTFFGVIVLLNVLIAVVCDSYQRSVVNARQLLGRARVDFATTFIAQQQVFIPQGRPAFTSCSSLYDHEYMTWLLSEAACAVVVCGLLWTASISIYFLVMLAADAAANDYVGEAVWWSILTFISGISLFAAITLILHDLLEKPLRRTSDRLGLTVLMSFLDTIDDASQRFARFIFRAGNRYSDDEEKDPKLQLFRNTVVQVMASAKLTFERNLEGVEERIKDHTTYLAEGITATMDALKSS